MAMKKHIVNVSYHTYVDVVVYADESVSFEDVLELGRQKAANNDKEIVEEILSNMEEDGNTEVVTFRADVFKDKNEAYNALLDRVQNAGGYILINQNKRPTFDIDNGNALEDLEPTKEVTIKSLVEIADDSSPLRFIGNDDEMYDVDDYLGKDDITELYAILMSWI